jgi:hypothetical protein
LFENVGGDRSDRVGRMHGVVAEHHDPASREGRHRGSEQRFDPPLRSWLPHERSDFVARAIEPLWIPVSTDTRRRRGDLACKVTATGLPLTPHVMTAYRLLEITWHGASPQRVAPAGSSDRDTGSRVPRGLDRRRLLGQLSGRASSVPGAFGESAKVRRTLAGPLNGLSPSDGSPGSGPRGWSE